MIAVFLAPFAVMAVSILATVYAGRTHAIANATTELRRVRRLLTDGAPDARTELDNAVDALEQRLGRVQDKRPSQLTD